MLAQLDEAGASTECTCREAATGTAVITIDPTDVSIIVIAGANGELGAKDVEREQHLHVWRRRCPAVAQVEELRQGPQRYLLQRPLRRLF